MDSLSVLFDGATAFGFLALCSIHIHIAISNHLKTKHLVAIETRVVELESLGCHAEKLSFARSGNK